jgi:DNA-directed RNA polymerase specialized sigma24 family protein
VQLRYFLGASDRQIAAELDVSTVNARRIVFNALQRLRRRARQIWPLGRF